MAQNTLYQYANCSTCRKARGFLEQHQVPHQVQELVGAPPSAQALEDLWRRSGLPLRRFFNTSGQSYRQGGFKERLPQMTQAQQLEALAADGKLIKRPLLDTGDTVLVGFKEAEWRAALQLKEAP